MSDLDELLSQPLTSVADGGFSHRVILRIEAEQRRRDAAMWIMIAILAAIAIPFVPLHEIAVTLGAGLPAKIGAGLLEVTNRFAASTGASLALVAIVLGFVLEREFSRS